LRVQGRM
jgi:hypothetical protein